MCLLWKVLPKYNSEFINLLRRCCGVGPQPEQRREAVVEAEKGAAATVEM
jgi:hypothetical protein